jgi:long-chain acyl-CoA synthetase
MPESTLRRFHKVLPHIQLQQPYGLSEVGILRSKSRSSDSTGVKLGGEAFQTRVVNGILQIKGGVSDARLSQCAKPVHGGRLV